MSKEIDWEKLIEEYELENSPDEFVQQVFALTTSLMVMQLNEKNADGISVEMGEFELILKRAKPINPKYNH